MIYGYVCADNTTCSGGNVYFIRDGLGHVKIGLTKDVLQRKKELQTANPCELEIFYVMHLDKYFDAQNIERALHKKFSHVRMCGEWFHEHEIINYLRNAKIKLCGYKFDNADW